MSDGKGLDPWEWVKILAAFAGIASAIFAGLTYWQDIVNAREPTSAGPSSSVDSGGPATAEPEAPAAVIAEPKAPAAVAAPEPPAQPTAPFSLDAFESKRRVTFNSNGVWLFVPSDFQTLTVESSSAATLLSDDGQGLIRLETGALAPGDALGGMIEAIKRERLASGDFGRIDYTAARQSYLVFTGRTPDDREFYECTTVFRAGQAWQWARFRITYRNDAYDKAIEDYMFDSFIGSIGVPRGG